MRLSPPIPPWVLMWLLALALYALAKVTTLALAHPRGIPLSRKLAYLLLFPGMNAASFCIRRRSTPRPRPALHAALNFLTGAVVLWGLARAMPRQYPLLQGWVGMIGLVLLLHFGLLQFAALACQSAGFDAPPLMRQPLLSASVTEFWGLRWNTAFHHLAHQFLFRPLARRTGPRIALLLTFAVSGLLHDLVISVPARAGLGLPTAYFLLQAAALLFERSRFARLLLHHRLLARSFAFAVIALPAPLLFHPPFVTRVILPFMIAIGALPAEVCS